MSVKGLNYTDSGNRFRFQKLSEKLQNINVDVVHRVKQTGSLDATVFVPDSGSQGCFFQDELENHKDLNLSSHFKSIWPLVQSLAELLHNLPKVVDIMKVQLMSSSVDDLPSYLQLVSVLARDVQDDLSPYFHDIIKILTDLVDKTSQCGGSTRQKGGTVDPQVTGNIFECMAHLLRFQLDVLVEQPDCLRPYYGPLIGHRTEFIRTFSAQTFSIFLRKLSTKAYRSHFKRLMKALASSCRAAGGMEVKSPTCLAIQRVEGGIQETTAEEQCLTPRVQDLLDGIAQLLFFTLKGVKGCFHSKGGNMLSVPLSAMLPLSTSAVEEILSAEPSPVAKKYKGSKRTRNYSAGDDLVTKDTMGCENKVPLSSLSEDTQKSLLGMTSLDAMQVYCAGRVALECVRRLFRHMHPSNMAELWLRVLEMVQGIVHLWTACRKLLEPSEELYGSVEIASLNAIELLLFALSHSGGRALSAEAVRDTLSPHIVSAALDLADNCLNASSLSGGSLLVSSARLARRCRLLFCRLWCSFSGHQTLLRRVRHTISLVLAPPSTAESGRWAALGVEIMYTELFSRLPRSMTSAYLLKPLLAAIHAIQADGTGYRQDSVVSWVTLFHGVLTFYVDNRQRADGTGGSRRSLLSVRGDREPESDSDNMDIGDDEGVQDTYTVDAIGAGLLHACKNELQDLTEAAIALMVIDADSFADSDCFQLEDRVRAALCVTWIADVCPQVLQESTSKCGPALKLVTHVQQKLIPTLLQCLSGKSSHSAQMLLAHLVHMVCSVCAACSVGGGIDEQIEKAQMIMLSDLLPALVDAVARTPRSMMLLWALLGVLELGICPSHLLKEQPEKRMILSGVLGHRRELSLLQAMADSLLSASHWLRICALRISSFLPPPAVVEQKRSSGVHPERGASASAAGDGGDLDDEPVTSERRVMDVVMLCLDAACVPASIRQEREYARHLGQVEVYVSSSRLPVEYLKVVCNFCLGMLHYKFQPLWEPAVNVLLSAVNCEDGKEAVWPLILGAIQRLSNKDEDKASDDDSQSTADTVSTRSLLEVNSGEVRVSTILACSNLFIFSVRRNRDNTTVDPDSRTDVHTVLDTVWNILQKSPAITLGNSRVVVSIFLRFLKLQYYSAFTEDPEVPTLQKLGVLSADLSAQISDDVDSTHIPLLSVRVLKKRLSLFLKVFAAVNSPKQLFQHQQLYYYYCTILSKPDADLVKLALDCIMTYKVSALVSYKDSLYRFLDDSALRDELLNFDVSLDKGVINSEHRRVFIPVMIRLLYGRFVSRGKGGKSAREQGIARRNAVLSFLSKLPGEELEPFVHMMVRGVVPKDRLVALSCAHDDQAESCVTGRGNLTLRLEEEERAKTSEWQGAVADLILTGLSDEDLRGVMWERQIGFLHLLEQTIKQVGFGLTNYVPIFNEMLCLLLRAAQRSGQAHGAATDRLDEDEADLAGGDEDSISGCHDHGSDVQAVVAVQSSRVRLMCMKRLTDLINQFESVVDFSVTMKQTWATLHSALQALPGSISGSISSNSRAPALLKLICATVQHDNTIDIVASREDIVKTLILCVGAYRASQSVVALTMASITALLDHRGGASILPHSELVIHSFSKRFVGPSFDNKLAELKLSELKISPSGSIREELKLLSSISVRFFSRDDVTVNCKSVSNLSTLLLGMIRTYTTSRKVRVEEDWVLNILRTYKALLWRVTDVRPHVPFVSRLFGPATHSFSLFNVASVRSELVQVYKVLSEHPSVEKLLMPSYVAIAKLTATDDQIIDGRDFAQCMPVFQSLSGEAKLSADFSHSWYSLLGPAHCPSTKDMSLCTAVVFECLRCMNDAELVVRGAGLAALKVLMERAAQWSGTLPSTDRYEADPGRMDIVKTIVVPAVRRGLKVGADNVKKGYIELLSHIITDVGVHCSDSQNREMFHSDMAFLTNEDPEQDFFKNICHIQMHRRSRIMTKIRTLLDSYDIAETGTSQCPISSISLVHVLLPLALHPLMSEDFKKKDHSAVLQESASLTGAIARHLRWSQYYNLIKQLLKMLSHDRVDKEKVLLAAVCAVLDSFHFDMKPTAADGTVISEHMEVVSTTNNGGDISDVDSEEEEATTLDLVSATTVATPAGASRDIPHIVLTSIIPWVRKFMLKDEKDHKGNKTQTVRTLVVVALVKLLKRLEPPIVSLEKINTQFTSLVMTIVGTLKSRDSSARDMARDSLARMINTMGISSMFLVLNELSHSLGEGFQRHVRNYTLRSLLTSCLTDHSPPVEAPTVPLVDSSELEFNKDDIVIPDFDKCIPVMMQFCLDDIAGMTHEDRNVDGAVRTLIREAKGNKANDILELCSKHILFRPSYALCAMDDPSSVSSIHAVVTPLLNALRDAESNGVVGRSSEALQRVALGLSKNHSVEAPELLLYLHATLSPFVSRIVSELRKKKSTLGAAQDTAPEDEDDELTANIPSYLNEAESDEEEAALYSERKKDDTHKTKAQTWLPFDQKSVASQRQAVHDRNEAQRALVVVQDGVHAPKLTGRNKYKKSGLKSTGSQCKMTIDDDPSFNAAVKFCLSLLLSCLKQNKLNSQDEAIRSMASPFLPLLGQCLRVSGNSTIKVLAMRCICALLSWGLSVDLSYSRAVGKRMLDMMYSGGAVLSTDSELVQTCIKGLVSLFQLQQKRHEAVGVDSSSEDAPPAAATDMDTILSTPVTDKRGRPELPLEEPSIRNLLSLLTTSILEVTSVYQNSAFQLIKLVVDMRIVVPEIYDLMNRLIEQVVLSHRKGVRETASNIVINFVITYPLGRKRLDAHMKQFIQNCSYEYEEGRHAALSLLVDVCRLMPVPVLDDYAQLIYLPIALQMVNDISPDCRAHAADVIIAMMRRANAETVSQCLDFGCQWMGIRVTGAVGKEINRPLLRTGAQVVGLIVTARPDLIKKGKNITAILNQIRAAAHVMLGLFKAEGGGKGNRRQSLQKREMSGHGATEGSGDGGKVETWSMLYHLMCLLEKMLTYLPGVVDKSLTSTAYEDDEGEDVQSADKLSTPILMEVVQEAMLFPHAWVRAAACRAIALYLKRRDPTTDRFGFMAPTRLSGGLRDIQSQKEFLLLENGVYSLARRLCVVLNYPVISPTLFPSLLECLVFVIRAMHHHPDTCSTAREPVDLETSSDEEEEEEEGGDIPSAERNSSGGSNWVMQRLRAIGADSRGSRRLNVVKVFAAVVREEDESFILQYMKQLIEVALRSRISKRDNAAGDGPADESSPEVLLAADDLLDVLEARVGSSTFIGVYGEVQRMVESSKSEKKRKLAADAISNPTTYAQRKVEKAEKKKESKKRKALRFAALKGIKPKKNRTGGGAILIAEE